MKNRGAFWTMLSVFVLTWLLTACAGQTTEQELETSYSTLEISDRVLDTQTDSFSHSLTLGDGEFEDYLSNYYHLEPELLQDGTIRYVGGADAGEIVILQLKDPADWSQVEDAFLDYISKRLGDFIGYMPQQVFKLEQAVIATSGNVVALLICEDAAAAGQAFAQCFDAASVQRDGPAAPSSGDTATDKPVKAPIVFDSSAILAAWRTGDVSALTQKEKTILDRSARVIQEVTTEDMTDYDKELAIHDWIIQWAEYDMAVVNHEPDAQPDPDNDNPYGVLVSGRAICQGYTSTFQLFMDMLGIECLTVNGSSQADGEEHAWNMVKLDGEWYCVDVTWNDPVDLEEYDEVNQHRFFNVTSEFLRDYFHEWDESSVPEATATKYSWQG